MTQVRINTMKLAEIAEIAKTDKPRALKELDRRIAKREAKGQTPIAATIALRASIANNATKIAAKQQRHQTPKLPVAAQAAGLTLNATQTALLTAFLKILAPATK